jgi:hypothetical protein
MDCVSTANSQAEHLKHATEEEKEAWPAKVTVCENCPSNTVIMAEMPSKQGNNP